MSDERIAALMHAVELAPENGALRLVLADALTAAGQASAALEHYERVLEEDALPADRFVAVGRLALEAGQLALAGRLVKRAKEGGVLEGVAPLQADLERELLGEPTERVRVGDGGSEAGEPSPLDALESELRTTFADVGGLAEVKKSIHRAIILPFQRPDLYRAYGRRAGGGLLLYGPPGCGKTLLARATAGECALPFVNVRLEDVLDPYLGVSERNLHAHFEHARANAPCVLFIDELDGVAYARRKQAGSAGRPLVDQILQEFDAIGADNEDLLVLAATNAPWDVDDALKRPGRLDRAVFVPPPDTEARRRILEILLHDRRGQELDLDRLAAQTQLFSGADLAALVERATDRVIDEALETGGEPPLTMAHLEAARAPIRPTTLEWLANAQNFVEFANQSGSYDEVSRFLRSREAKAWRQ